MLTVTNVSGFGSGSATPPFSVSLVSNTGVVDNADATTHTISDADLGSYAGDKHIILAINEQSEPGPISQVTIAGETATIVIEEGAGVYKQHQAAIVIAAVSGATSGDIAITSASGNIVHYVVSIFEMISGSGTATDTWGASLVANPTGTLTIAEGGFGLSVAGANTSATFTWSGMTERFDRNGNPAYSHAWDTEMSAETDRTITATPSGSPTQRVGIGASFEAAS
tara:strand:- start:29 stop:706 length:678 start_codon:yes stop_codon:yes gene_type:complete